MQILNILDRFKLDGKTALVTGGAKGLGKSISKALSDAGANVVIIDIDEVEAKKAIEELSRSGDHFALKADITNEYEVKDAIATIIEKYKQINILVNNAGICQRIESENMSLEDWKKTFDINVNAMFLVSKYVYPTMRDNGGGSIINMASKAGIISLTYPQSAYNASKGAVIMLTKSLAQEWVGDNIRVNAIAPGFMQTDMTKPMFENDGPLSFVVDLVPMKRVGFPHELGGAIVLLASEASSFTTGSIISIDGGYTMV
ncbi:SDR family NAD(P)-dependent oxidoreductase [Neobacillus sp. 19]|uniref:SDR family NAD(P)-dependent oxidoreductase n=1 Tax=Neobacillus sp. 19 TaxID=3394458 RepID=UPI003BF69D9B